MAYRNGTYIAFDGLGQTDPKLSDFKYYSIMEAWARNKSIDFKYVDSHDKTCAVRDSSLRATLESRIRERLSNSKNVVVILSTDTRKVGSMLIYEIEQAVDKHELPLILAYVDYKVLASPWELSSYWPNALSSRIRNKTARAIHIPFIKEAILDAINQFTMSNPLTSALSNYSKQAHLDFGVLSPNGNFVNTKK